MPRERQRGLCHQPAGALGLLAHGVSRTGELGPGQAACGLHAVGNCLGDRRHLGFQIRS